MIERVEGLQTPVVRAWFALALDINVLVCIGALLKLDAAVTVLIGLRVSGALLTLTFLSVDKRVRKTARLSAGLEFLVEL